MPVTDADRANVGNGMKRRTAGWTAIMALRHGPSNLSDTGLREMTNKELHRSYKNTNKNPAHYPRTMAANAEREDKLKFHKRRVQSSIAAGPLQQPRYTASQQSDVRLTGRGLPTSGSHRVNVDPAEMEAYGAALGRHEAGALTFRLSDEATWGGQSPGSALFSATLRRATGTYDDVVEAPTRVDWDFHQCLAQSGKPVEWMLVQGEQAKLASRLMWTDNEGESWTCIADIAVRRATGVAIVSFKHVSRKFLIENRLLDANLDDVRGTAKAVATAEVSILEPPDTPASAAPAGLPCGLAELVSRHHAPAGQQYGCADVKVHCSAATLSGKVDAAENWRKTGHGRYTVATLTGGQHVIVRALFRSRSAWDGRSTPPSFQQMAMVTPLKVVPTEEEADATNRLAATWARLGLVLLEESGKDHLCRIEELVNLPGYSSPVAGGGRVVAAVAPWIGLRSTSKRADDAPGASDDESEEGEVTATVEVDGDLPGNGWAEMED